MLQGLKTAEGGGPYSVEEPLLFSGYVGHTTGTFILKTLSLNNCNLSTIPVRAFELHMMIAHIEKKTPVVFGVTKSKIKVKGTFIKKIISDY